MRREEFGQVVVPSAGANAADAGEIAEEGLVDRTGVVIESARDREIEFHSFGIRSGLSDGFEEFRQPSHTRQADVASRKLCFQLGEDRRRFPFEFCE